MLSRVIVTVATAGDGRWRRATPADEIPSMDRVGKPGAERPSCSNQYRVVPLPPQHSAKFCAVHGVPRVPAGRWAGPNLKEAMERKSQTGRKRNLGWGEIVTFTSKTAQAAKR